MCFVATHTHEGWMITNARDHTKPSFRDLGGVAPRDHAIFISFPDKCYCYCICRRGVTF